MTSHDRTSGRVDRPDQLFDALAHPHRRQVLSALLENGGDGPVRLPEDADVATDGGNDPAIQLYHVHLPKLADAGLVRWEPENLEVEPGPALDAARPLLDGLGTTDSDD